MSNSKPIFAYHDLRGVSNPSLFLKIRELVIKWPQFIGNSFSPQIAYPIKLAMAYLDVDYADKRYPLTPAGLEAWGEEKPSLGLDFPNVKDLQTIYHNIVAFCKRLQIFFLE